MKDEFDWLMFFLNGFLTIIILLILSIPIEWVFFGGKERDALKKKECHEQGGNRLYIKGTGYVCFSKGVVLESK